MIRVPRYTLSVSKGNLFGRRILLDLIVDVRAGRVGRALNPSSQSRWQRGEVRRHHVKVQLTSLDSGSFQGLNPIQLHPVGVVVVLREEKDEYSRAIGSTLATYPKA